MHRSEARRTPQKHALDLGIDICIQPTTAAEVAPTRTVGLSLHVRVRGAPLVSAVREHDTCLAMTQYASPHYLNRGWEGGTFFHLTRSDSRQNMMQNVVRISKPK